ncbi:Bardet-Biedl syndrome 2 protein [Rhizophlyctis rosea]|uniref:Bardet-Biedl syndrome 2 protein n=1 Tax=Rhizophlyctis rosea TaxID=64517 RepID=A0AAD5SNE7_9FUNG|nr:Bardet-Biedl syndrome 2 protein [Rhizophlyctis rosea]
MVRYAPQAAQFDDDMLKRHTEEEILDELNSEKKELFQNLRRFHFVKPSVPDEGESREDLMNEDELAVTGDTDQPIATTKRTRADYFSAPQASSEVDGRPSYRGHPVQQPLRSSMDARHVIVGGTETHSRTGSNAQGIVISGMTSSRKQSRLENATQKHRGPQIPFLQAEHGTSEHEDGALDDRKSTELVADSKDSAPPSDGASLGHPSGSSSNWNLTLSREGTVSPSTAATKSRSARSNMRRLPALSVRSTNDMLSAKSSPSLASPPTSVEIAHKDSPASAKGLDGVQNYEPKYGDDKLGEPGSASSLTPVAKDDFDLLPEQSILGQRRQSKPSPEVTSLPEATDRMSGIPAESHPPPPVSNEIESTDMSIQKHSALDEIDSREQPEEKPSGDAAVADVDMESMQQAPADLDVDKERLKLPTHNEEHMDVKAEGTADNVRTEYHSRYHVRTKSHLQAKSQAAQQISIQPLPDDLIECKLIADYHPQDVERSGCYMMITVSNPSLVIDEVAWYSDASLVRDIKKSSVAPGTRTFRQKLELVYRVAYEIHLKITVSSVSNINQKYVNKRTQPVPEFAEYKFVHSVEIVPVSSVSLTVGKSAVVVVIRTDNIQVAAKCIASITSHFNIMDLEVRADFPRRIEHIQALISTMKDAAEMVARFEEGVAEAVEQIQLFMEQAEDSRSIGDILAMKETYNLIYDMNRDLMMEHAKRIPNHKIASESKEEILKAIFEFANLRGGETWTHD